MEGRGDGRRSGYRIPLDLGRGEANLRFRRFCISLHSGEIYFIIEAAPRQPQNAFDDDQADLQDDIDEEADDDDDDYDDNGGVAGDSQSERGHGDGHLGDSDGDLMPDDNERLPPFFNLREQYACIRFIWQVWPFSCDNIFDEIVFEFQGIREEDLAIRDYDTARENLEDGERDGQRDGDAAADQDAVDRDAEGGADDAQLQVGGHRALERADERPPPAPAVPNVGSEAEEIDQEAFRWWHEFDYNFSESVGIDVDEEDPPPAGCEKRPRESSAQDAKRERKSAALRLACERQADLGGDAPEEEGAPEEGASLSCPGEAEAEAEPSPGPSRKRSRDEAGLGRETRRTKRLCRRSDCDAKTSEDSLSGGAARRS